MNDETDLARDGDNPKWASGGHLRETRGLALTRRDLQSSHTFKNGITNTSPRDA